MPDLNRGQTVYLVNISTLSQRQLRFALLKDLNLSVGSNIPPVFEPF